MYQTESTEALKLVVRFSITWQNNCSYVLKLDKVLRNENKIEVPSNLRIEVSIVETNTDSYIQEISSSLLSGKYQTRVTKIP